MYMCIMRIHILGFNIYNIFMGSASAADFFFCIFVCIIYGYWADYADIDAGAAAM